MAGRSIMDTPALWLKTYRSVRLQLVEIRNLA